VNRLFVSEGERMRGTDHVLVGQWILVKWDCRRNLLLVEGLAGSRLCDVRQWQWQWKLEVDPGPRCSTDRAALCPGTGSVDGVNGRSCGRTPLDGFKWP